MSQVCDIVRDRPLFSVQQGSSVAEVARRMAELHVGAILVLNGDDLRGLFSERDLMKRVVLEHRDPARTPVEDVMTMDLATIDELADLDAAMELMNANNCRHLPVMRGS